MIIEPAFKKGDKVCYDPKYGKPEFGIVKSLNEYNPDVVFVVFHCNGNWNDYEQYTGQSVVKTDLKHGWL